LFFFDKAEIPTLVMAYLSFVLLYCSKHETNYELKLCNCCPERVFAVLATLFDKKLSRLKNQFWKNVLWLNYLKAAYTFISTTFCGYSTLIIACEVFYTSTAMLLKERLFSRSKIY